ncbi:MAG: ParB N-terminal domain-containing protein [Pseudomonadota bacterium]
MKLVDIDSVKPSTYNPRTADPRRLDIIELSLRKLGFLLPIYASEDGEIISGHQRHHVAKRMGLKKIPVATTKPMPLDERKAINIAFNRGTNDLRPGDTPSDLTAALRRIDLQALADKVPDKEINTPEFYPCMSAESAHIKPFLQANKGKWIKYTRNISKALLGKGILMPIVATKDYTVVNGIGRLQMLAEEGKDKVDVVYITQDQAALSDAMLNLLSMDFDIHNRYADLLRYNSFRRSRRTREDLGRGFVFAVIGRKPSRELDLGDPKGRAKWIKTHGASVVDFGAGHMTETNILRNAGIHVNAFEPYRLTSGEEINKEESIRVARAFFEDLASGKEYSSVFIASVLNSIPFKQDRQAVVCICHALCNERTRLYAVASSKKQADWRSASGAEYLNNSDGRTIAFKLNYEDGVRLGEISSKPKMQKFHEPREFYLLFSEFFARVNISEACNNVQAIAAQPKPVDPAKLAKALEFEFDLPYPDGTNMGLVDEAKAAFTKRLGIEI